nr:hypothetical protein [uncultured Pseudomonas sp.]
MDQHMQAAQRDASLATGSVALAVAEGVRAGGGAHFSLVSG